MKNNYQKIKKEKKHRRCNRTRAKIKGAEKIPRLSVFRSNRHIWCQLIDDEKGKTFVAASDQEIAGDRRQAAGKKQSKTKSRKSPVESRQSKVAVAFEVGKLIAEKSLKNKIKRVLFDRGEYKYHGRVKALADGAREGGLSF